MNGDQDSPAPPSTDERVLQRQRLLNVAKALREDPDPQNFTMNEFTKCGTPACALGHYAARKDLQDVFYIRRSGWIGLRRRRNENIGIDNPAIHEHFGIDYDEADELFGMHGCNWAQTPLEAAVYIEKFVEEHP